MEGERYKMTIGGIIILATVIVVGIMGIAIGAYEIHEFDEMRGVIPIIFGVATLFLSAILIVCIIDANTETTEKVIGKGTIVTEVDFNYSNGGKDSSNETKYFIEIESGNKIIVDKSEWDKIKDEYTYIPSKVDIIKED